MVGHNDKRTISVQGNVGSSVFLLEIPAGVVHKAAALLDLAGDGESPTLERKLRDLLSAEAFRVALGAGGHSKDAWQAEGFHWDQPHQCWHRVYPWSAILHMLFPRS